jgi:hypothetical protein
MKPKRFWIKERHNPQLGTYYVAEGQLSMTAARRKESSLYGTNIMHEYATEADYNAKIAELKKLGRTVQ